MKHQRFKKKMQNKIYFIDYRKQDIETLTKTLKVNQIQVLVDIRQNPYSITRPIFNKDVLEKYFKYVDIGYKFLGKELGANSFTDYDKHRKALTYQNGIYYLECGLEFNYKIALMFDDSSNHNNLEVDLKRKGYEVELLEKVEV